VPPQPFFLAAGPGWRHGVHHAPAAGAPRGLVLYLHPWGEEMNKSRRMAAMQSRALAAAGLAVLQIDLHGCGDSSDTWAEASWAGWVDDALRGVDWLQTRHASAGPLPLWLWGLRSGALLAVQAAARLQQPCDLLLWQPATSGKLLLQQFLRLKAAADLGGDAKATMAALRSGLAAGQAQDVAGYALSPALANGLEAAQLSPLPAPPARRLVWLETSTRDDGELLPASRTSIQAWTDAGHDVRAQVVHGPAFWQTVEIEDAPALLQATTAALAEEVPA
jgi:exosortase A-associated hydrolase 2